MSGPELILADLRNETIYSCKIARNRPIFQIVKQSPNLDLLRSAAVLAVLWGHLTEYSVKNSFLSKFQWGSDELAHFAVLMFFIHTSLVLMMSLARLEKAVPNGLVWRFYVRRVARIYPLAILVVFIGYTFQIPRFPGDVICSGIWLEKLANIFLFQNLIQACEVSGPLWSLPYEVQMYLVLPFAYWLGKRLRYPSFMLVIGFAVWYFSRKVVPGDVLRYAPWFCMGIYAFFRRAQQTLPAWMFCVALFSLLAGRLAIERYVHSYMSGWLVYALGLAFCYLLPAFRNVTARFLTIPAHSIAKYSYGIYLTHAPVMWLAFTRLAFLAWPLQAAIFVLLMVVMPVLLYHTIEEPMIRVGINISESRAPRRTAVAIAAS